MDYSLEAYDSTISHVSSVKKATNKSGGLGAQQVEHESHVRKAESLLPLYGVQGSKPIVKAYQYCNIDHLISFCIHQASHRVKRIHQKILCCYN